jgi:hypothetical protein
LREEGDEDTGNKMKAVNVSERENGPCKEETRTNEMGTYS